MFRSFVGVGVVGGGGVGVGEDYLHGGPKQLIVEAGLASLPHSWDGARPPRSHSQETDLKEIKISVIIQSLKISKS